MATALVDALSPTSESRAGQERQFSRHEEGLLRDVGHPAAATAPPTVEPALAATREMCAYCFGGWSQMCYIHDLTESSQICFTLCRQLDRTLSDRSKTRPIAGLLD